MKENQCHMLQRITTTRQYLKYVLYYNKEKKLEYSKVQCVTVVEILMIDD